MQTVFFSMHLNNTRYIRIFRAVFLATTTLLSPQIEQTLNTTVLTDFEQK